MNFPLFMTVPNDVIAGSDRDDEPPWCFGTKEFVEDQRTLSLTIATRAATNLFPPSQKMLDKKRDSAYNSRGHTHSWCNPLSRQTGRRIQPVTQDFPVGTWLCGPGSHLSFPERRRDVAGRLRWRERMD